MTALYALFNSVLLRFCLLLLTFAIIILILMRNISLRKKVTIDHEHYRTLVHAAVKECIIADVLQEHDPVAALIKLTAAQATISTASSLVGGMDNLTLLSGGLNVGNITNTMTFHERQMRATLYERRMLKSHSLSKFTQEHVEEQSNVNVPQASMSPTSILPPLQLD